MVRKISLGRTYLLALIACLSVVYECVQAQDLDTTIFKTMKYRNVGPNRGGRSLAAAGSALRPNEYYFGATGGGLWKTLDGGLTWNPVTDGQITSSSVGAIAVSPTNPDIVYIGTGESQFRGNIIQGDGVYKTIDGGKTWVHCGLKNSQTVARLRIHPTDPSIIYAVVLGHAFGSNEERGVFKSTDGGKTWRKVLYRSEKAGGVDLTLDPTNPNILYASLWEVYRKPWMMWGGGGECGLFKSIDGGESWVELTTKPGMPKGPIGKIGITVSPVSPNRIWTIVEANEGGVFRSDDGGETWTRTNDDRKLRQRAFYYSRIYADTKDKDGVYVLNVGFYKSMDGGKTFDKKIAVPHGDNHDLWIDPSDPLRMILADDGGGTVTLNGGLTWTDQDFPTAQLYHITATSDFPYHVAGAQQDNTTVAVPSEDWKHMELSLNTIKKGIGYAYEVGGGESGYIAQDPLNPDVFYAGSYSNMLTRINRKTGERREVQPYPRGFMGEAPKTLPERVHWTFPIVFSPVDPTKLYVCSQHVWVTQNEGQTWKKISPDLTYGDTSTLGESGGVITKDMSGPELYGTVYALAPSYHDANTIWAGSDDGLLHITRNHGESWENITPPDMPKHTRISIIEASPHKPGTAYVAAKRYQMNDRRPYIWKTNDYGKSWEKIIKGIEDRSFVHVIREDKVRPGLLFAGTEYGVKVSFNDGEEWNSLQLNLPVTQVPDMVVTEKDLAIATHGRSMYILDDIWPLREYKKDIVTRKLHLYKPGYAVRRVQNLVIQYHLANDVDSVVLEILDQSGKLVRTLKGRSVVEKKIGDTMSIPPTSPVKRPTVSKGLNQFEWDLRYPGAILFKGLILWSARPHLGPLAPPGMYFVRISAGGVTATEPFEIRLDPRLTNITTNDINDQFQLVSQIRDEVNKAHEAIVAIRIIKDTLVKTGIAVKQKKLITQLSEIEAAIYQVKNQTSQDPLNYPIRLNNKIATLQRTVESGENKPTDDAYKVFGELKVELNVQLEKLSGLLETKLLKRYYRRQLLDTSDLILLEPIPQPYEFDTYGYY